MESRLQTAARAVRGTARRAALTVQDLGTAPRQIQRLRVENKQLRHELKVRGWSPQPPDQSTATRARATSTTTPVGAALSDEQRDVVDRFHMLYRDGLRLDKKTFWRGARVIKCPLDLWIYQELIAELKPDLIIETGTMYGGSAFYFASILDLVGHGEVLTIDRNHRDGRPEHPRISYMSGRSSTDPGVLAEVGERAHGKDTVMVLLDSNHKAQHVLQELRSYHSLVTPGSYLVVEDTNINGHPVEDTFGPGPMEALHSFLQENHDFEIDRECEKFLLTFNPDGWLRRKTPAS